MAGVGGGVAAAGRKSRSP